MIIGHLNIHSIAAKIDDLKTIIQDNIDVLIISDPKLNQSHTSAQVSIDGFNEPFRLGRIIKNGGGGIIAYIRSSDLIPAKLLTKHSFKNDIEGL